MQVYLLRHGIAEEERTGLADSDRALTAEGRSKLRPVLETAAKADVQPTLILSSPYKRALQTAAVAKQVFRYKGELLQTEALTPSAGVEAGWDEVRSHREEPAVLLVGHNPLFENLAGYFLGYRDLQVDFKKGSLLRVDFERFGSEPKGILRWYLTAKLGQ